MGIFKQSELEKNASRIVGRNGTSDTRYIVAEGALYIKKPFRRPVRHEIENAEIIAYNDIGIITVDSVVLDGLKGVCEELVRALRIERDFRYPNSTHAQEDRKKYISYRWENPQENKPNSNPKPPRQETTETNTQHDLEERARRVVGRNGTSNTKYIVADGALYIKKAFRKAHGPYDLDSATITADHNRGIVTVNDQVLDGLQGVTEEFVRALRIERAFRFPNTREAQEDRRTYPNYRWEEADQGPAGRG